MTAKSRAELNAYADQFLADNTTRQIKPLHVRTMAKDLADSFVTAPVIEWEADINSTIATGGTAQPAVAAGAGRIRLVIMAPAANVEPLYYSRGGTAIVGTGTPIFPGNSYDSGYPPDAADRLALSIIAATTGTAYTIRQKVIA